MLTRTGQIVRGQPLVQRLGAAVPGLVEPLIDGIEVRAGEAAEEFIHRRHDVGMRIEGAAGKADVGGAVVAKAPHQILAAADHADRKPAGEALAVGHHVGADAEIFLRAAGGEAEADEDLVEDQDDAALGADLAQLLQPFAIGRTIERALARTVDERGIAGRVGVGVQRLQRIDQHAGDVARVRSTCSVRSDMSASV